MSNQRPEGPDEEREGVTLTTEQLQSRRARNIAIGLGIAFLVGLFYAVTLVKLSGAVAPSAG